MRKPCAQITKRRSLPAGITIAFEFVALTVIRWRFFETAFIRSLASITLGGTIIVAISAALSGAAG